MGIHYIFPSKILFIGMLKYKKMYIIIYFPFKVNINSLGNKEIVTMQLLKLLII